MTCHLHQIKKKQKINNMEFEYTEHLVNIPISKANDVDIARNSWTTQSRVKVTTQLHSSLSFFLFYKQVE